MTGKSESEIARQAIDEYLERNSATETCYDVALKAGWIGSFNSGNGDLSTNPKHIRLRKVIASLHSRVLVDRGSLVAVLDDADARHLRCFKTLALIRPPMLTTWPVVTEATWLLRGRALAPQLYSGVEDRMFRILPLEESALSECAGIRMRHRTLSIQLADMSLLDLAERQRLSTIFTLDRRDFDVVRRKSARPILLIP